MATATATESDLQVLPCLDNPSTYDPSTFDYYGNSSRDPSQPVTTSDWLEVFRKSIPTFAKHCLSDESVPAAEREAKAKQFSQEFGSVLDALDVNPRAQIPGHQAQPVNCASLCLVREQCLRTAGFGDVFLAVKAQENAAALKHLPAVLKELDQFPDPRSSMAGALKGVFAGNIFDLGAAATAEAFEAGGMVFSEVLAQLLPRPWVIDDFDAILDRLDQGSYKKALMFVDNAGADIVLGMIPLARELLKRGTEVVLAANHLPSINDITAPELGPLLQQAGALDLLLQRGLVEGALRVVDSGNDMPVIDLRRVSSAAAAECQGCDLIVLEGMGRSIETNLNVQFTVDSWKLGMVKHPEVAACLGGRMYDCVCRYTPGTKEVMN